MAVLGLAVRQLLFTPLGAVLRLGQDLLGLGPGIVASRLLLLGEQLFGPLLDEARVRFLGSLGHASFLPERRLLQAAGQLVGGGAGALVGGLVGAGPVGAVGGALDGATVGVVECDAGGSEPVPDGGTPGALVGVEVLPGVVVDGPEPELLPRMSPIGPLPAPLWRGTENGFDG
jgi:hypothetical protein